MYSISPLTPDRRSLCLEAPVGLDAECLHGEDMWMEAAVSSSGYFLRLSGNLAYRMLTTRSSPPVGKNTFCSEAYSRMTSKYCCWDVSLFRSYSPCKCTPRNIDFGSCRVRTVFTDVSVLELFIFMVLLPLRFSDAVPDMTSRPRCFQPSERSRDSWFAGLSFPASWL